MICSTCVYVIERSIFFSLSILFYLARMLFTYTGASSMTIYLHAIYPIVERLVLLLSLCDCVLYARIPVFMCVFFAVDVVKLNKQWMYICVVMFCFTFCAIIRIWLLAALYWSCQSIWLWIPEVKHFLVILVCIQHVQLCECHKILWKKNTHTHIHTHIHAINTLGI